MAIAATTNESTNNAVLDSASKSSTSQDLHNSFLTLLVAQLKNQDPTNPMQNNELTSQLAQINTVQGIEKLNTTLGAISGQINSNQSLQASALIGHGVMVPGNNILVGSKEGQVSTTPFGVELERAADQVTATITNANGQVVRTIEIGGLTAGCTPSPGTARWMMVPPRRTAPIKWRLTPRATASSWWRVACTSAWLTV